MRYAGTELRRRKDPSFWKAVNRILLILVSLGAVVMIGLWFYPQIQKRNEMLAFREKEKAVLDETELLRKHREREVYLLENDKEYIETIARDKLDLMKQGETIFRLDGAKAQPVPPALPPAKQK